MKIRHVLLPVALLATVALGSGCGFSLNLRGAFPTAPVMPPIGAIYSKFSAPLTANFDHTPVHTAKYAELKTQYIFIPFFGGLSAGWGDVSLQSLAHEAGLSEIHYADYEVTNYLTLYSETRFKLYGE